MFSTAVFLLFSSGVIDILALISITIVFPSIVVVTDYAADHECREIKDAMSQPHSELMLQFQTKRSSSRESDGTSYKYTNLAKTSLPQPPTYIASKLIIWSINGVNDPDNLIPEQRRKSGREWHE
jgi:hypothetical protein